MSPFHTNDLAKSMDDFDQVPLRRNDCLDGLVGGGGLVDDVGVLAALDTFGHALVIFDGEASFGFSAGHGAAGAVTAAHEALRVAFAANDVRARPHAAWDDTHVAFAGTDCAFAGDENVLVIVAFASHV